MIFWGGNVRRRQLGVSSVFFFFFFQAMASTARLKGAFVSGPNHSAAGTSVFNLYSEVFECSIIDEALVSLAGADHSVRLGRSSGTHSTGKGCIVGRDSLSSCRGSHKAIDARSM